MILWVSLHQFLVLTFYIQFFKISLFLRYKYTLAYLQQNIFNKKLDKLFLHIVHVTLTSLQ